MLNSAYYPSSQSRFHNAMKQRKLVFISTLLCMLVGCVQHPEFDDSGEYASVVSSHPVVMLDGVALSKLYQLQLEAGEHEMLILYNTIKYEYNCYFKWYAEPNTQYEVVDHENAHPLTLYRWVRRGPLWAVRLDPVTPVRCEI